MLCLGCVVSSETQKPACKKTKVGQTPGGQIHVRDLQHVLGVGGNYFSAEDGGYLNAIGNMRRAAVVPKRCAESGMYGSKARSAVCVEQSVSGDSVKSVSEIDCTLGRNAAVRARSRKGV